MLVEIKEPTDFAQLPANTLASLLPKRGKTGNVVILILWSSEGVKRDEVEVYGLPPDIAISKDYIINVSTRTRYKIPISNTE
jgi:hypothetical protein